MNIGDKVFNTMLNKVSIIEDIEIVENDADSPYWKVDGGWFGRIAVQDVFIDVP